MQCSGCPYNTLRGALVCAMFRLPLQYLKRSTGVIASTMPWEEHGVCVQIAPKIPWTRVCASCLYNTLRGALVCAVFRLPQQYKSVQSFTCPENTLRTQVCAVFSSAFTLQEHCCVQCSDAPTIPSEEHWWVQCSVCLYNTLRWMQEYALLSFPLQYLERSTDLWGKFSVCPG